MIKKKLTKKEIALSALTFFICHLVLLLTLFLALVINTEGQIAEYMTKEFSNVITVTVSVTFLTFVMYFYFFVENREVLAKYAKIMEIYFILCVSLLLCDVVSKYVSPMARPLTLFAFLICMFFKKREAIFLNSIFMLISFMFNRYLNSVDVNNISGAVPMIQSFAALFVIFCCGIAGVFLLKRVKTRLGCVLVGVILFLPTIIINVVLQLPALPADGGDEILDAVLYSIFDCASSILLFMCLLPIVEGLFSELTAFRLRELTSDNAKIIAKMKKHALGTYNHCVIVAQLAEACASAIGEDSELARAVAYYHDVGKLKNPDMFAENQSEYDLHRELTPELSVDIIRSHTKEGAKLIKKHRLPDIFADVAVQHHGTMPIKYFYAKALKMSDGEINAGNYSYSGPTPTTKIAAIIMIADASEAAARSLSERTPEKVAALVSSIVEERMNMEQFIDCDITMAELNTVTRTVINQLTGVYHSRVKYPKLVLSRK